MNMAKQTTETRVKTLIDKAGGKLYLSCFLDAYKKDYPGKSLFIPSGTKLSVWISQYQSIGVGKDTSNNQVYIYEKSHDKQSFNTKKQNALQPNHDLEKKLVSILSENGNRIRLHLVNRLYKEKYQTDLLLPSGMKLSTWFELLPSFRVERNDSFEAYLVPAGYNPTTTNRTSTTPSNTTGTVAQKILTLLKHKDGSMSLSTLQDEYYKVFQTKILLPPGFKLSHWLCTLDSIVLTQKPSNNDVYVSMKHPVQITFEMNVKKYKADDNHSNDQADIGKNDFPATQDEKESNGNNIKPTQKLELSPKRADTIDPTRKIIPLDTVDQDISRKNILATAEGAQTSNTITTNTSPPSNNTRMTTTSPSKDAPPQNPSTSTSPLEESWIVEEKDPDMSTATRMLGYSLSNSASVTLEESAVLVSKEHEDVEYHMEDQKEHPIIISGKEDDDLDDFLNDCDLVTYRGVKISRVLSSFYKHILDEGMDHFGLESTPNCLFLSPDFRSSQTKIVENRYVTSDLLGHDHYLSELTMKYWNIDGKSYDSSLFVMDDLYFDLKPKRNPDGTLMDTKYGKSWITIYIPVEMLRQYVKKLKDETTWPVSSLGFQKKMNTELVSIKAHFNPNDPPKMKVNGEHLFSVSSICKHTILGAVYKGTGMFSMIMAVTNDPNAVSSNIGEKEKARLYFHLKGADIPMLGAWCF